jgi:hypothetical protein
LCLALVNREKMPLIVQVILFLILLEQEIQLFLFCLFYCFLHGAISIVVLIDDKLSAKKEILLAV